MPTRCCIAAWLLTAANLLIVSVARAESDDITVTIPPEPPGGTAYQRVKQLLPPHVGCAVMVLGRDADGKEVAFKQGFGVRQLAERGESDPLPMTPATNFRVSSFTKVVTAAAVLKLADQGALNLTDSVLEWLPGLPEAYRPVTVRSMLDHTSGLPAYHSLINQNQNPDASDLNVLRAVARSRRSPLPSQGQTIYSNTAYVLLGLVVQQASGRPFADYLQDEVLVPAGMTESVLFVEGLNQIPHRAFGHQPGATANVAQSRMRLQQLIDLRDRLALQQQQPNEALERQIVLLQAQVGTVDGPLAWHEEDQGAYTRLGGDGALYTSLNDLQALFAAIDDRRLPLSDEAYDDWLKPCGAPAPNNDGFGDSQRGRQFTCGWMVDERLGEPRYSHRGATKGFRQTIQWMPESRRAVVVLMNSVPPGPEGPLTWDDALIEELGERVMREVLGLADPAEADLAEKLDD
ncbi:Penicillin-binding protein 4* [Botrimarina colliarenosi]|uniref:Penicillin-binding protein 4 n=1 Tax=Botrimarina colliarenosi TaxID=2528001 RepID=A0A5C6AIY2_9BACT|nr:serine hydrolase domain-containing protein [Botrimarina colliarenosi]TWT99125.1 Penicillin-binding protein 4* [Botrimarina colliarenosi]